MDRPDRRLRYPGAISQHRIQRAGARGGPAQGRYRRGPASRSLLIATPAVAVALGVLALAANNDLSTLSTTGNVVVGRPATTTTTTTRPTTTTRGTQPNAGAGPVSTLGAGGVGGSGTGTGIGADPGTGGGSAPGVGGLPGGVTTLPGAATVPGGGPVPTNADGTSAAGGDGATTTPDGVDPDDPTGTGPSGTGTGPGGRSTTTVNPALGNPGQAGRNGAATSTTRPGTTTAPKSGGVLGLVKSLFVLGVLVLFATAGLYLLLTIIQALRDIRRRPRDDGEDDDLAGLDDPLEPITIDAASARLTLEQIRAELESEPDPRVAIRHAYSMVESGFGAGGGLARRRTESPLQYLERSLGMIGGNPQSLRTLTGLFLLARYSNRPINEAMRAAAIRAVIDLQGSYRLAVEVAA